VVAFRAGERRALQAAPRQYGVWEPLEPNALSASPTITSWRPVISQPAPTKDRSISCQFMSQTSSSLLTPWVYIVLCARTNTVATSPGVCRLPSEGCPQSIMRWLGAILVRGVLG
jgi:hypothetical protein